MTIQAVMKKMQSDCTSRKGAYVSYSQCVEPTNLMINFTESVVKTGNLANRSLAGKSSGYSKGFDKFYLLPYAKKV